MIEFTVSCNPSDLGFNGAVRHARTADGQPITYLSKEYRDARDKVTLEVRMTKAVFTGPVMVDLVTYYDRLHREGPAEGLPFGDVDATVKGVLDALEKAGTIQDDAQVMAATLLKSYDKNNPRVEVVVMTPAEYIERQSA